jgi:hypothetical protein
MWPVIRPPRSERVSIRSNCADPSAMRRPAPRPIPAAAPIPAPLPRGPAPARKASARLLGVFSQLNITWKSGVCARLRTGCTSSTTCSKGMSWFCCASSARAFTRPSSSATVGARRGPRGGQGVHEEADQPLDLPPPAVRRGRADHHVLLAREPAQHHRPPGQERHVQRGPMPARERLQPRRQLRVQLDAQISPPEKSCRAGRGRSVGSSSSSGAPASVSFQYSACAFSTSPSTQRRCHTA